MKILVMGLPGSGKTTLADKLASLLTNYSVLRLNADEVRKRFNDYDFSIPGRLLQAIRMNKLAKEDVDFVICDFVAPLVMSRMFFAPDFIVWMNTIEKSQYKNTNALFVAPKEYDLEVQTKDCNKWADIIYRMICAKYTTSI